MSSPEGAAAPPARDLLRLTAPWWGLALALAAGGMGVALASWWGGPGLHDALDWQRGRLTTQPWRWWSAAFVHLDTGHLAANLAGVAAVAAFGVATGLGRAADDLKPGLAATIAADLDHLAAAWPGDLPSGTIHADFFPDNVFFRDGAFAAAIDFYFACDDAYAYDLAVALNAWCFESDGSFNLTAGRAMIGGYEAHRPLTAQERAALPVLAHGAAMRFFLTRLNDWGSTPAGALVRPKDPLEYERKLAVHRAGLALLADA